MKAYLLRAPRLARAALLILAWLLLPLPAAQAAAPRLPAAETVDYTFSISAEMKAAREGAPVCPGDTVTFIVRAWRSGTSMDSRRDVPRSPAFGVPIDVLPPSGDTLRLTSPKRAMTSLDLDLPAAVEFTFTARKPGKANITFEAFFPARQVDPETRKTLSPAQLNEVLYADVKTSVEVADCPLQVSVVNQYLTNYGGVTQHIVTAIDRAALKQVDTEGKRFTYEGQETVVVTEKIPACQVSWSKVQRAVTIEATKGPDGFHIVIQRGPTQITVTHTCENGSTTNTLPIPDAGEQEWDVPLNGGYLTRKLNVPPATSFWWVIDAKVKKSK